MTNQLRRFRIDCSNIAEGQGRLTPGEWLHFLGMAIGSALEVETQLKIAKREGFANVSAIERTQSVASEVVRILNAAITGLSKLKRDSNRRN